nr:hypothetical protein [Tanacetum cinerariifolium]
MSGTVPPIPPPLGTSSGSTGNPNVNRIDTMPTTSDPVNAMTTTNCKTAKEMWNDLILAYERPSDTRDTKIASLRLKFNAFKSLEEDERTTKIREFMEIAKDEPSVGKAVEYW